VYAEAVAGGVGGVGGGSTEDCHRRKTQAVAIDVYGARWAYVLGIDKSREEIMNAIETPPVRNP
jgi:hypothetical protein